MTFLKYLTKDNVSAQINGLINSTQTTFNIKNGVNIPTEGNWILTAVQYNIDGTVFKYEEMLVISIVGNTVTVVRGYAGTSATSFNDNDYVFLNVVSEIIKDLQNEVTRQNEVIEQSPVENISETSSKGGLLINIDSATGDVARTTNGYIEDEKHGVNIGIFNSGTGSAEFDSTVKMTGKYTLKLTLSTAPNSSSQIQAYNHGGTTFDAVTPSVSKNLIPLKPNTKYKFKFKYKTDLGIITTNGFRCALKQFNSSYTAISGESAYGNFNGVGENIGVIEFTSNASASFLAWHFRVQQELGSVWIDYNGIQLDGINETTNDNLTTKAQGVLGFTAIGSTDNIDQSNTTASGSFTFGQIANKYSAQSFVPTKENATSVIIQKNTNTGTFTGNITFSIQTDNSNKPSGTLLGSSIIPNATWNDIPSSTDYTVNIPCKLTSGTKYWIVCVSSTADDTNYTRINGNATSVYPSGDRAFSSDGITWSISTTTDFYFKTLYYKPTTAFNASLNGDSIDLRADEDGFLDGAKIDLVNGNYSVFYGVDQESNINVGQYLMTQIFQTTAYTYWSAGRLGRLRWDSGYVTYKIKVPTNFTDFNVKFTLVNGITVSYSLDNSSFTTLIVNANSTTNSYNLKINGLSDVVYIKFNRDAGSVQLLDFGFNSDIDTSSIKTLYNYPTNKSNKQTYVKTLTSATTTAIYRATKYGFPAIEFTNGEFQYLKVNCEATDSVVKFSADGTSYTTVTDGGNIALSSTTLPIVYTDITITKNRLLMSSNDYNNSSDKDGSLQAGIVSIDKVQGLVYDVQDNELKLNQLNEKVSKINTSITDINTDLDGIHIITDTITSGTYTPTVTGVTNVSGTSAYLAQYIKVGNIVTVSGKVDIDPTSTGLTVIRLTLPIASNFTAEQNVSGTSNAKLVAESMAVYGDTTNKQAALSGSLTDTSNRAWHYTYTYVII